MEILETAPRGLRYEGELDLRYRVLRAPLGWGRDTVTFPFEAESRHWVALEEGRVVGCVLFHPEGESEGRLFQMAVDPQVQGTGLGRELVGRLEKDVAATGIRRGTLHARATAMGFYQRLGYSPFGPPYEEVGIPHQSMERRLLLSPGHRT